MARFADCVQSVISQAGVDTEVLIIDDASTDRSPLVAAELAARHPNVEARVIPGESRAYCDV